MGAYYLRAMLMCGRRPIRGAFPTSEDLRWVPTRRKLFDMDVSDLKTHPTGDARPDHRVGLPNVLGIGFPKSGTSFIVGVLNAHPEVCVSSSRGTHYFSSGNRSVTFEPSHAGYRQFFPTTIRASIRQSSSGTTPTSARRSPWKESTKVLAPMSKSSSAIETPSKRSCRPSITAS